VSERAERLLPLVFDVPGNPRAWSSLFGALAQAISPDVSVLVLLETAHPTPTTTLFGVDMQHVAVGLLPRRSDGGPRLEALPEGAVFELPRLPPRIANHPVVRQLLEPAGLEAGPGLGMALTHDGPRVTALLLVLPRRKGWKPSAADHALLSELSPYLAQAARLHDRLAGAGVLTSLLDHLVLGVVLLDDRGRVSYANRSAAEMLGVAPGLTDPSLGGERDTRTEALYRGLTPHRPDEKALYSHPADGRPLQLLHTDLDWSSDYGMSAQRFRRALFIGDPKQRSGDPTETMAQLYGLTPGEAKLSWLLIGDFSLAEAATQLGITLSTARTVLKRVLSKTGAPRQASLVRLLLSGPGQLRDDAPPGGRTPSRTKRRRS
jgi:DNA-binding CsgD family transcriptional regulator